jgi:hypothetical protein
MPDNSLHTKLDGLKELIEVKFRYNAEQHQAIRDELNGKANGWVERLAKGAIGTILFTVLGALLALVLGGGTVLAFYKIIT